MLSKFEVKLVKELTETKKQLELAHAGAAALREIAEDLLGDPGFHPTIKFANKVKRALKSDAGVELLERLKESELKAVNYNAMYSYINELSDGGLSCEPDWRRVFNQVFDYLIENNMIREAKQKDLDKSSVIGG